MKYKINLLCGLGAQNALCMYACMHVSAIYMSKIGKQGRLVLNFSWGFGASTN